MPDTEVPPNLVHTVETVAIGDLKPHPRNYRNHPEDQIVHLMQSIREHGLYRNVVVAVDDTVLAGHGVVVAAKRLGLTELPIIRLPIGPDHPAALKVLTGDNELGLRAEVDDRNLSMLLKEIMENDANGLLGTGYDELMLANLLFVTRPASEIADLDEAAHWVGLPEYGREEKPLQLVISFDTAEDRLRLVEEVLHVDRMHKKMEAAGRTWSCWWPPRDWEDLSSLRWDEEAAAG